MPADQRLEPRSPPFVAVGGLGGSGTRLVAALLAEFGIFLGHDMNAALDNLAFTLLFKRRDLLRLDDTEIDRALQLFAAAMTRARPLTEAERAYLLSCAPEDRVGFAKGWLGKRIDALIDAPQVPLPASRFWGWKAPITHLLLPALVRNFPDLRYIHVVRNGLDMAFSPNQTQLNYWGDELLGPVGERGPARALHFWCEVQERARRLGEPMGNRFMWLNYDRLCLEPEQGLADLARFLGLPCPDPNTLLAMIRPPPSMGRYRRTDCSAFSADDIAAVVRHGFAAN